MRDKAGSVSFVLHIKTLCLFEESALPAGVESFPVRPCARVESVCGEEGREEVSSARCLFSEPCADV